MGFYDADKVGEPDEQVELDLTNSHLPSLDGVDVRQTLEVRSWSCKLICNAKQRHCKDAVTA